MNRRRRKNFRRVSSVNRRRFDRPERPMRRRRRRADDEHNTKYKVPPKDTAPEFIEETYYTREKGAPSRGKEFTTVPEKDKPDLKKPGELTVEARRRRNKARRFSRTVSRRNRKAAGPVRWDDLELSGWWDSETREFQEFVLRLLASFPGQYNSFEDMGFEGFGDFLGWKEIEMVTELMDKIQSSYDVEQLYQDMFPPEEEEDEEY